MTGLVPKPGAGDDDGWLAKVAGPFQAGDDERGRAVVDQAAVQTAQRVGDDRVGEVAVEVERFLLERAGCPLGEHSLRDRHGAELLGGEPVLVGVALGQRGEVDGLAEEAERHLQGRLGGILGVHVVRSADLGAETDPVVADHDIGEAGVNGHFGELQRGEHTRPGDGRLGAEPPVTHPDRRADLVGACAVHGLGLGGDAVDISPADPGVGERSTGGVDDESEHGPVMLPGWFDLTDADDGNGHGMTPSLMIRCCSVTSSWRDVRTRNWSSSASRVTAAGLANQAPRSTGDVER